MSTNPQKPIIAKDTPVILFAGEFQGTLMQGVAAAVLLMPNGKRYTVSQLVSVNHKDEAEYTALIIGLQKAQQLRLKTLAVKGDSDLVFNQVNGLTSVTEERLRKLYRTAIKYIRSFEKISLEWISPEQNRPATSAVKRCIKDALGREKPQTASAKYPAMVSLMQKGEQARDEDYNRLTVEEDEWTHKSLQELRALIPVEVRDKIALQWQGDEDNLAQMYRWHLRGLPAIMACRKVNLDQKTNQPDKAKLPWEEALNVPQSPFLKDSDNTSDPLVSLLSELDKLEMGLQDNSPSLSESQEPISFASLIAQDFKKDNLDSFEVDLFSSSSDLSFDDESDLVFDQEDAAMEVDKNKDTLPSLLSIVDLLQAIENLSAEEKNILAEELVKIPEMVNLILKAIADNVSHKK
ncbi:reverse transcriptase-like protein [Crocosphaera sp. Alani8]|uniref:reverse transcriptase-like protein n=1 Tax=Crocosphaera sp. Alani8 TaxID=3038952 RepID=UPI00313D1F75